MITVLENKCKTKRSWAYSLAWEKEESVIIKKGSYRRSVEEHEIKKRPWV
jgi:hypothetical protein